MIRTLTIHFTLRNWLGVSRACGAILRRRLCPGLPRRMILPRRWHKLQPKDDAKTAPWKVPIQDYFVGPFDEGKS